MELVKKWSSIIELDSNTITKYSSIMARMMELEWSKFETTIKQDKQQD